MSCMKTCKPLRVLVSCASQRKKVLVRSVGSPGSLLKLEQA